MSPTKRRQGNAGRLSNDEIAARLNDVAVRLEDQGANQYRVQAWRGGAAAIRRLNQTAGTLIREQGLEGFDRLPGIGPALARACASWPRRAASLRRQPDTDSLPSVAELLEIDRQYRERGAAGELPTIAPRRFNPTRERWLPILHARRGGPPTPPRRTSSVGRAIGW